MEWLGKVTATLALSMAVYAMVLSGAAQCQEPQTTPKLLADGIPQVPPNFGFNVPTNVSLVSIEIDVVKEPNFGPSGIPSVQETLASRVGKASSTNVEIAGPETSSSKTQSPKTAASLESPELLESTLSYPWWSNAMVGTQNEPDEALGIADGLDPASGNVVTQRDELSAAFVGRGWELDELIWLAVEHSPYIQSVLIEPQILQTAATQASGQFDPSAFVDSIFHDTSDPVGNTLTTGGAARLNDHVWDNRSGFRGKNTRGGQTEFSQQFLFKDSNSNFFVPSNQADTKMLLRYTQPLMRGRGQAYNKSSIVIASLKADQNSYEVSLNVQQHVFQITSAYWELYVARANYAQIELGLKSLMKLKQQLVGRADLDGLRSQLMRADAAIARQEANLARALAQILASEATLRAAVAAPELRDRSLGDVIPSTPTADWRASLSKEDELRQALDFHPDIQAIRSNLQATRVQLQVAEHELRPTLNLVLEGYVRGLNGGFNAVQSVGDQFSTGAPSYSAGLSYLRPTHNTTARAILREKRLEMRRELLQLDNTLLTVGAEVEGALANVQAAFQQLESAVRSTMATNTELEYLRARWNNAFLDNTSTSLLLDQLLNAHVQLIQAENGWARAQADHMLSIANLRLSTGTLLPMIAPIGASELN